MAIPTTNTGSGFRPSSRYPGAIWMKWRRGDCWRRFPRSNPKKALKKKDGKVTLVGFGTFSVSKRKARKGRNPQTGETIKIAAAKVPKFTAGKGLKDAIK